MTYEYDDGGRGAAGYKGKARDCVCRAIAIASNRPYKEVYNRLAEGNAKQRKSKYQTKPRWFTADEGIITNFLNICLRKT